jgi:hypothetical protein
MVSTETVALIFDATATVVNAAFVGTVFYLRRQLASRNEMTNLDKRVSSLEQTRDTSPSWEVLSAIKESLGKLDGEMKALTARLDGYHEQNGHMREAVDRIQEYLLGKGK